MPLFTNLKKSAIRLVLEGIVAAGREKAFVGWLENVWRDLTWERNRYYHLKEILLASLLLELRLVQGASLRTINIADQYIAIARRHLGPQMARTVEAPDCVSAGTSRSGVESSRLALEEGAFDVVTTPLEDERTVNTIRLALWYNKFKALIACREKALEKYRQHMANYPGDRERDDAFQRALAVVEKAVSSVERTFQRIDESAVCFSDFATKVEYQARTRALERLNSFPK
jgi:hypothetical protein